MTEGKEETLGRKHCLVLYNNRQRSPCSSVGRDRTRESSLTARKNEAMRGRTRTAINFAIMLLRGVFFSQEMALALSVSRVRFRGARRGPA